MKKIFNAILISLLGIIIPNFVMAEDYYIVNYNIKINVNSNNIYNIEESFTANFNNKVDTINIKIPYYLKYNRSDGTLINKRAIISDIEVDNNFSLTTEEGYRTVYIGNLNENKNTKYYLIKYNYNVGNDTIKNEDEFVFYFLNTNAIVNDITFTVNMPKSFSKENISFIDENGIEVSNIEYTVEGRKIKGIINTVTNPGINYGIKIKLDDNYFKYTTNNTNKLTIISIILSIILILITLLISYIIRRKTSCPKYHSVYFDKNINSLEMSYLYNGYLKEDDIPSLFITLANKGFINIEINKNGYKITRKKDYDLDDTLEKAFMKELFSEKDELDKQDLLTSISDMKTILNNRLKTHKTIDVYTSPIFNYKIIFWLLIWLIFIINNIQLLYEYQTNIILFNILISGTGLVLLLNNITSNRTIFSKIIISIISIILISSPIILSSYKAFLIDFSKTISYIIGIISIIIIFSILTYLGKRSLYGRKMYNKINAYKEYLLNMEDKVVSRELLENKDCFYRVLPYTFTLNIFDEWYHKFADKKIGRPSWYKEDNFELEKFYENIKKIYIDILITIKKS